MYLPLAAMDEEGGLTIALLTGNLMNWHTKRGGVIVGYHHLRRGIVHKRLC